jgi:DNA-binding NarL/FixJ family response regulator
MLKEVKRDAILLEASSAAQAALMTGQPDINLVLLDLNLPDGNGLAVLEELRRHYPTTAVVVLSATQDRSNVVRALELGASGYIPKSARREVILSAIQLVLAGGVYIPPQILEREAVPEAAVTHLDREHVEVCGAQLAKTRSASQRIRRAAIRVAQSARANSAGEGSRR